jgi:hypothetical protein
MNTQANQDYLNRAYARVAESDDKAIARAWRTTQRITPTEHEKREWRRMATAAYDLDLNDIGHRCSAYGALRIGESIPTQAFDEMQINYREWLITGFGKPTITQ